MRNPALSQRAWLTSTEGRYVFLGVIMPDGTTAMAHLLEKETLLRANSVLLLALVGGGLAACAVGAVIYDIGRMVGAW